MGKKSMIRNRARIGDAPLYMPGETLFSFSQDPRVASNLNPIYAVGSPQYLAAMAAGAVDPNNGQSYPAPGTPGYAALNPAAPLTLNPPPSVVTSMPTVIGTPAATPAAAASSLSSLPWYYYAGGAAVLLFLFSGKK